MAESRVVSWGLIKNGTVLATGTEQEMLEFQEKLGGEIKKMAVTKPPTAAELLANERKAQTAAEQISGKRGQARSTVNMRSVLKNMPRFVRGGGGDD